MESLDLSSTLDREQLEQLLIGTLTKLCHSKVSFKNTLSIEGLVGLTVDDTTVQLISIKEVLHNVISKQYCDGKPGSDLGCQTAMSKSRRKCQVTRKVVTSKEGDCGSDLNDDWNRDGLNNDMSDELFKTPVFFNKSKVSDWTVSNCADSTATVLSPLTSMTGAQREFLSSVSDHEGDNLHYTTEKHPMMSSPSKRSRGFPVGKIRKYGSYGYVINEGDDVMFSCNQCPKMFRNRVSLWRHGVKHKMSETKTSVQVAPPALLSSAVEEKACPVPQQCSASVSKLSHPAEVANDMVTFQNDAVRSSSRSEKEQSGECALLMNHDLESNAPNRDNSGSPDWTLSTVTLPSHMSTDPRQEVAEINMKNLHHNQEHHRHSSPSVVGEQMELSANIPEIKGNSTVAFGGGSKVGGKVKGLGADRGKQGMVEDVILGVAGEDGNVKLISDYGYTISTTSGKIYQCITCTKSFKHRVSLWKHQAKHQ